MKGTFICLYIFADVQYTAVHFKAWSCHQDRILDRIWKSVSLLELRGLGNIQLLQRHKFLTNFKLNITFLKIVDSQFKRCITIKIIKGKIWIKSPKSFFRGIFSSNRNFSLLPSICLFFFVFLYIYVSFGRSIHIFLPFQATKPFHHPPSICLIKHFTSLTPLFFPLQTHYLHNNISVLHFPSTHPLSIQTLTSSCEVKTWQGKQDHE